MIQIDKSKVTDIVFANINHGDAPDYADAYIEFAMYNDREMTDAELEELNQDSSFVYNALMEHLY